MTITSKAIFWLADRVEAAAFGLYFLSCLCMVICRHMREYAIRKDRVPPTVAQYYQRLIEFYDPPYLLEAAKRMDRLIVLGVTPEHAFRMITSD